VPRTFSPLDWDFIENIPFSTTSQEDYWAWEVRGLFSSFSLSTAGQKSGDDGSLD